MKPIMDPHLLNVVKTCYNGSFQGYLGCLDPPADGFWDTWSSNKHLWSFIKRHFRLIKLLQEEWSDVWKPFSPLAFHIFCMDKWLFWWLKSFKPKKVSWVPHLAILRTRALCYVLKTDSILRCKKCTKETQFYHDRCWQIITMLTSGATVLT